MPDQSQQQRGMADGLPTPNNSFYHPRNSKNRPSHTVPPSQAFPSPSLTPSPAQIFNNIPTSTGAAAAPPKDQKEECRPSRIMPPSPPPPPQGHTQPSRNQEPVPSPPLTAEESHILCAQVAKKVQRTHLGRMWDRVVEADRRGIVGEREYVELLDFFYCFVPMVVRAPANDPIIVSTRQLKRHEAILEKFGSGSSARRSMQRQQQQQQGGVNRGHEWFSRPR